MTPCLTESHGSQLDKCVPPIFLSMAGWKRTLGLKGVLRFRNGAVEETEAQRGGARRSKQESRGSRVPDRQPGTPLTELNRHVPENSVQRFLLSSQSAARPWEQLLGPFIIDRDRGDQGAGVEGDRGSWKAWRPLCLSATASARG